MTTNLPGRLGVNIVLPSDVQIESIIKFLTLNFLNKPELEAKEWAVTVDLRRDDAPTAAFRKGVPSLEDLNRLGAETFADGLSIIGDPSSLKVRRIKGTDPDRFYDTYGITSGWRIFDEGAGFLEVPNGFDRQMSLYRGLVEAALRQFEVLGAHIIRYPKGFAGVSPPHAYAGLVMYLARTDLISQEYDSSESYFKTWDTVEHLNDQRTLVTRGLEIKDEIEFKGLALEKGIELARSAKPGRTEWKTTPYPPIEADMIFGFESHLNPVGYFEDNKSLEFTTSVQGNQLLSPTDIMTLLYYRAFGTDEGDPVEKVIATFIDEESAERNSRILRDINVEIQYYSEAGEIEIMS